MQGIALICELAAQERGLGDNSRLGLVSHAQIDTLMSHLVRRLTGGIGIAGSFGDRRPACESNAKPGVRICFVNIVIARYAGFFAAYVFSRFPNIAWTQATRDAAYVLFAEGNWYPWAGNVGNSALPLVAMRLFAGEFFNDPVLFDYGRSQLYAGRDHAVRKGLAEPMAPHYAGMTLTVLAMMTDTSNLEIRGIAEDLLALSLLVPAHLYLPGGGLGAPQQREKTGGGIADPDPTAASHLIPALNMLVYDPQLHGAGHPSYGLASGYQAPEIIRSIFLDKGAGYTFEYRGPSPSKGQTKTGWYPARRSYRPSGRGIVTSDPLAVEANPWASVTLPGGHAQMGLVYGSGGMKANSAGLYVRKPGPIRGGQHLDFSILYQHQPRRPTGRIGFIGLGAYDPLIDDPTWHWERKSGSRRMLYGRTAISLFEVGSGASFPYSMVHLPDFSDPEVGDGMLEIPSNTLPGHSWFVGRSGGVYVAYLPLGTIAKRKQIASGDGDWIYLQLGGRVSGGITELATRDDFPTLADYAKDLAARHVAFRGTSTADALAEIDVFHQDRTKRIRLEFARDRRYVDGVPQADADFLMLGGVMRSPFVSWDENSYTLTVERDGYVPLILNFGDPRVPTAPRRPKLSLSFGRIVRLCWKHGYDDIGITSYDVYRNDRLVGSVDGDTTCFTDRPPIDGSEGALAHYTVASRDTDGNVSPTRSRILEVRVAGDAPNAPKR